MRLVNSYERGDTIIEVLFAVAVFAMVAVGSLSIMNQGTATAQRSLEITLVRQQIDAQAEAIRYIHQSYVTAYQKGSMPAAGTTAYEWIRMTDKATGKGGNNPSAFGGLSACPTSAPGDRPFIVNARKAEMWNNVPAMTGPGGASAPPFAQVTYDQTSNLISHAYGIWIEAIPSTTVNDNGSGFVDFHIRTCWDGPGSTAPMTLGTIVRLYEPRQ